VALADDIAALIVTPAVGGTTFLADAETLHAAAKSHELRLLTPTAVQTAAYTAASGQLVQANATTASLTVTLPAATAGLRVGVTKVNADTSTNTVTIAAAGTGTISGTTVLRLPGEVRTYTAVAGQWVMDGGATTLASLDARYASLPAPADKVVFVSPRGSDTNDGFTIKSALATLSAAVTALGGPGLIQCGQGTITFGTPLSVAGTSGVTIRGVSGVTAGVAAATVLSYAGTGTASAINAQNTNGFTLADVMLLYTQSTFTGRLLDLRNVTGSDTAYASIRDCYLGGAGIRTADALIDLSKAISCEVRRCVISNGVNGIRGLGAATEYSNGHVIEDCTFVASTTAHIRNVGQGWTLKGNTWEQLFSGAAGSVINDPTIACDGLTVLGGWCGDVVASAGGAHFVIGGYAISIIGTYIGGNTGSTGVKFSAGPSNGIIIAAHFDHHDTGIDHAGFAVLNFDYSKSTFATVTTPVPSGALAQYSPTIGNYPVVRYKNDGNLSYGGVSFRMENWLGTYQGYDVGVDNGGGSAGTFTISDVVRNKYPFQITKTGSVILADTVLPLTATDGFTYVPTCAGTPTGVPIAHAGTAPVVYDTTGNKLWIYNGAWKGIALA
jgi:hypothetical protein